MTRKNFLEWFVGFTEGDGSFLVDGKRRRLYFIITQKDPKLLYAVRKGLAFGSVTKVVSAEGIWKFTVSDQKGVDRLIHLFNGKFLLRKVSARFSLWLEARNSLWGRGEEIERKKDPSPTPFLIGSTGWLSGFTEAEGCFSISKIEDARYRKGFRIRFRYILDQKGEREVLESIRAFLASGDLRERSPDIWRFTVTHRTSCFKLIHYFKRYPLRGKKSITFLRWKKALRLISDGLPLLESERRQKRFLRLIEKISPNIF